MYVNGLGGPQDDVEARPLLGLAAAQGYAQVQNSLGFMHKQGLGWPQDDVRHRARARPSPSD
eukprot:6130257-Prymnesium_polylepis.1